LLEDRSLPSSVPFAVGGSPLVNPDDFRITAFATGLDYPYTLLQLSDGSLLVGTSRSTDGSFFYSTGELLRLVDADHDGVADGPGTVLYTGLPGLLTAVRQAGSLFFVTSSFPGSERVSVLRAGATPADPLTLLGSVNFAFPAGWEHTTFELAVRPSPASPGDTDLFFNVGSPTNAGSTTDLIPLSGLLTGSLHDSSIYLATAHDTGGTPAFSNLRQVASGLRNAASMTYNAATGELWFVDNGIDGDSVPEEEVSADKVNFLTAAELAGPAQDYGFPSTYIDYNTGQQVGTQGVPPVVAFLPSQDGGAEVAGAAKVDFAPPQFPAGLNTGLFVGFHGISSAGGAENDENPVAYVDPATRTWFPFIAASQDGVGHLDSVLATRDSLFLADLATTGDLGGGAHLGAIYQIQALHTASLRVDAPAAVPAGAPFDVTVSARDAFGHVATNYAGTVAFSTTDPYPGVVLPATYTFTATDHGSHTFAAGAALFTAGPQAVTAADTADPTLAGAAGVTVTPAAADHFLLGAPTGAASGTPFDVTVSAVDPYGNLDTNYAGTVTFFSDDPDPGVVLPADYTFTAADAGAHTFTNTGLGETTLITPGDTALYVADTPELALFGAATVTVTGGNAPPPAALAGQQPRPAAAPQAQPPTRGASSGQETLPADRLFAALREASSGVFALSRRKATVFDSCDSCDSWWLSSVQPGTSW
jgi:glucose/arabinose dehydrogenase